MSGRYMGAWASAWLVIAIGAFALGKDPSTALICSVIYTVGYQVRADLRHPTEHQPKDSGQ